MTDQTTTPPTEVPARTTAGRQLEALGLTEHQAVALLLPVIAETYREVADDAEDGAHGDTWGTTPEEALTGFAEAYRKLAADCDLPGAPLPEATRALERERAGHEEHRRQLADALGHRPDAEWPALISTTQGCRSSRKHWKERTEKAERAANLLADAERNRQTAESALARVRKIASRLAAHAAGFQEVLDDSDRDPWARTVRADLEELRAALPDGGA